MMSDLPSTMLLRALTYSAESARTRGFSSVSGRLEPDTFEAVLVLVAALSFDCDSATLVQTSVCDFVPFAASFISFDGAYSADDSKWSDDSDPRAVHLPCSTQNESIGSRPEFAGTIRSTAKNRSCLPPLTISPAWT